MNVFSYKDLIVADEEREQIMSRKSVDISQGSRRYQRLGGTIGGDGYTDRQVNSL